MVRTASLLAFFSLVSLAALTGCPLGHQSPPARAQEAATELNVNARFGRMEMATERVAPTARDAFLERRRLWGASVRVADYEMAGFRMLKGDTDAEVLVRVSWYRVDQGDLRITTLRQKWHDFKGDFKLVEEVRADGDLGLLGEYVPPTTSQTTVTSASAGGPPVVGGSTRPAQFPTIRLGGSGAPAAAPEAAPATIAPPPSDDP